MDDVFTLQALCLPSILPSQSVEPLLIPLLICDNRMSLSSLDLGVEFHMVKALMSGGFYRDSNTRNQVAKRLKYQISSNFDDDERPVCLPNLTHVRVRGLDFSTLMLGDGQKLVDFGVLTHLTLESCCGLFDAVLKLGAAPLQSLQSFRIRHERVEAGFLDMLEPFLCALPPLTALFVLLDGDTNGTQLIQVLEVHGKSLQALVMDLRHGTTIYCQFSTLAWRRQYSIEIFELCPNLIELGIAVDWDELALDSSDSQSACSRFLQLL